MVSAKLAPALPFGLLQTLPKAKPPSHPSQRPSTLGFGLGFSSLISLQIPSGRTTLSTQLDQFAVIDHRTVITGSFNWSPSAAHQNDETLLVFDSPMLAAHFSAEVDRLWKGAELGITERQARKQERQRNRCGSGVQRG